MIMTHYKECFHSHTYYCDGKNSPEEMVQSAVDNNFTALGFSGHAYIKDFYCQNNCNVFIIFLILYL